METKTNILIIVTDQLTWKALPAYGNKYGKTPNIDRIASKGVIFDKCYTTCPLCQPARASFWTGLFPHQTGVLSNGRKHYVPELKKDIPTLGSIFSEGGYDTVHFGKKHDSGSLRGFYCEPESTVEVEGTDAYPYTNDTLRDRYTALKSVEYLNEHGEQPFLMVADMTNPHNICSWIGEFKGAHEDVHIEGELPVLPDNFEFDDIVNRPLPVQYICCSHNRQSQAAGWTPENFRHYLAAYYHYIERVDTEIGLILDALEARKDADNTLIVLMADHGDGMSAHGMVTKQVGLYEETTRVPFIFAGPCVNADGHILEAPLVSLMDLLPTLCDYSGLKTLKGLWGKSLVPWIKGERNGSPHPYVVCEWHTEWGFTIEPGRMVRGDRYKYVRYIESDGEEFYDLEKDPGETKSLMNDTGYLPVINEYRQILKKHAIETEDPFFSLEWEAAARWRSHKPGYQNHTGPAAPMAE